MEFEIDFNKKQDDKYLINELGAYYLEKDEYPGLFIEVKDFEHLKELLLKVSNDFSDDYSAIVSYDPLMIYLDDSKQ